MKIYNLQNKIEYLDEVARLEYEEWAVNKEENKQARVERKKVKISNMFIDNSFCKLILLDKNNLVGFISLFPSDCEEEKDLAPWYATMYVKKEYRNQGCSRILHEAILNEAKKKRFLNFILKNRFKKLL